MNDLLLSLQSSFKAASKLCTDYHILMLIGKVNTANPALRIKLHHLSGYKAGELRTQLITELDLEHLIDFSFNTANSREVSTKAFFTSINQYSSEWEQALAAHANDESLQNLITEIIALPLEMKRLIDNDRGDYIPYKVKPEPELDPMTATVIKYHRQGRLNELFKTPDQNQK